jgi:hypothetical protein
MGYVDEEIENLQRLLAIYLENEDTMIGTLITQIQQRLEVLKACV